MNIRLLFYGFVPQLKQNPLAGAMLSGLGSLGSSLFSQDAQQRENEDAREWQEKMWNKTNEYNSPKNQRKLLQEGGYNPYLFGDDYNGSGANQPGTPNNAPLQGLKNPMDSAFESYSSIRSLEQRDTDLLLREQEIQNNQELQHAKAMESINQQLIDAYKEGGQDLYDKTYDALKPVMEHMNWQGSYAEQKIKNDINKMNIDNARNQLEFDLRQKYGDKEGQAKLNEIYAITNKYKAEYQELLSRKNLNYKEIEALGARMARDFAEVGLLNSKSSEIQVILPYTRAIMEDNSLRSSMDENEQRAEYVGNRGKREFLMSPYNQEETYWREHSQHSYVLDFIKGFTDGMPTPPAIIKGGARNSYHYNYGKNNSYL